MSLNYKKATQEDCLITEMIADLYDCQSILLSSDHKDKDKLILTLDKLIHNLYSSILIFKT